MSAIRFWGRLAGSAVLLCGNLIAQPLPPVPVPPENPLTPEKVLLGKILFWEEQMSGDDTVACGTCHRPEQSGGDPRTALPSSRHPGPDLIHGTDDDIQGSASVVRCTPSGNFFDDGVFWPGPLIIKRKAQGFIGHQWDTEVFWDGRFGDVFLDSLGQVLIPAGGALETQATLIPPSGTMGCQNRTWPDVAGKLQVSRPMRLATNLPADVQGALNAHPTYPSLFAWAFGDNAITRERVGFAIASYERTLIPDQTPWDAFVAGQTQALTPGQQQGWAIFQSVGCADCHVPPLFTDQSFHNIGVRPPADDLGRFHATGLWSDRGKFKTTSVRNAGLRGPYFHNGRTATLEEVILFYERGGDFPENIDPLMVPFTLSALDRANLVDFLANGLLDARSATAVAPFDRPTLNSELPPNPQILGVGSPGSGGVAPQMVAPIPPMIGSLRFGVGLARALGGSLAYLALSPTAAPPGLMVGPATIWVAPDPLPTLVPFPILGPPGVPGSGYASVMLPLADDPALAGVPFLAQWLVADPGAPLGFTLSPGVRLVFFAP